MNQINRRMRGEGKIGCIFWILVLIVVAMIAIKVVPVKIQSAEFYDYMEEQAKFGLQASPEGIKRQIMRKAQDLDIPLKSENLTVQRVAEEIRIHCTYQIPIDFPGYTYVWKFDEKINRPLFYF